MSRSCLAPMKANSLEVEVYDPAYFIDFSFAEKEPVALKGAPAACSTPREALPPRRLVRRFAGACRPAGDQVG